MVLRSSIALIVAAVVAAGPAGVAAAGRKTVCTITVNSADERETLRRRLPADEFDFVELVERGRPDWLASACQKQVRCDALLISGHFDGGTEFYSDRLDAREYLPVDELERASCSDSCPGLFAQLKEVYLFGCNTLNAEALKFASAEIERSLLRSGHSRADAEQISRALNARHGESNRDRMRLIFKDVPVLYGFSAKAPLGPVAATLLERYFQSESGADFATGHVDPKLLGLFAPSSMTLAAGLDDADPLSGHRQDVCQFADERLTMAQKLDFTHRLMGREMAEVRMFLDRIEKQAGTVTATTRQAPEVAAALDAIAGDTGARDRYLDLARDADELSTRVRMLDVARTIGWLSPEAHRTAVLRVIGDQAARNAIGPEDVDLVCRLNQDRRLDDAARRIDVPRAQAMKPGPAAALACLGHADSRMQVLRALTSADGNDAEIAQVYLGHRPVGDVDELRAMTTSIAQSQIAAAQVRALDTLAGLRLSDRESLDALTRLFPRTRSLLVQRAIAGVLIRSDYHAIATADVVRVLRQHRLRSPEGDDVIDVLIRRLQASS